MEKRTRVLNVLVAGHAQAGKSSLIEAIVGKFPDNLDFELAHGTTVSLKVIQFYLRKQNLMLNFLDSPGHADFKGGIALGLEFTDLLVLVISGTEGFQARTYWLFEKATEKNIPIVIATTKMDINTASTEGIFKELEKRKMEKIPIIETSAKKLFGIDELVKKISIFIRARENVNNDLSFIILGFETRKGIGELLSICILSGTLNNNSWITEKIKIRHIFSLNRTTLRLAIEGEIVQISLNVNLDLELGTTYKDAKFIPPKFGNFLSEIQPRKEYYINIINKEKFTLAIQIIEKLKKVLPLFDYYIDKNTINVLVMGDLQFDFLKERLEDMLEFEVAGSKIKGIITINKESKGKYNSASVKIRPRVKNSLTILRVGKTENRLFDLLGASVAYDAFHLDGLHVDIYNGKNEDDIAQAIAKAIEKVKLIKIEPYQDVIVKVENYHDIYQLIEQFNIEVLHQSQTNTFFLQVKNQNFESFFNSLMKVSQGRADLHLFKFEHEDVILSVDPGTRHYGFCLIKKGELPSLWFVNLKRNIEDQRTHNIAMKQLKMELEKFLETDIDLINKIFVGNGPGSKFIIDFFIEFFSIPCEDYSCVITDLSESEGEDSLQMDRFRHPDIYLVDEFKTTKEALFHLQQGKLISEVKTKGFVDHAIAALLIAKRGLKGEVIKIEKKPLKQLFDYVVENYAGSYSFKSIHNISSLDELQPGIYLRVKDASKLDSNLKNGDVVAFVGFGDAYNSIHASTLSGNRVIIKFQGTVKVRRDFFKILVPVKERT